MLEQELKELWKNSSAAERIKFDLSRLLMELNGRVNKLERSIRTRDIADLVTAIISIPIFGYIAYAIPFPITKVGVILAMIGFVWGIVKRRNHQRQKLPISPAMSFRDQLQCRKSNLLEEIRLSDTVLYWFLIPGFIPFTISILGLGDPADYGWSNAIVDQLLPMPLIYKLANLLFALVVFAAIYWANKRLIRKTLKPIIEEIENAQMQLENEH